MSVTSSQVPELMKLGEIPTNLAQDVTTDILDPVVFSQTYKRFKSKCHISREYRCS